MKAKINNGIMLASSLCLLWGCTGNETLSSIIDVLPIDIYPETLKGNKIVLAHLGSNIHFDKDVTVPVMLIAGSECKILAEASRYGQYSLRFTPYSVSCTNPTFVSELNDHVISDAFVDHRFHQQGMMITFELYADNWQSALTTLTQGTFHPNDSIHLTDTFEGTYD